jgi:hypothetical protein
VTNITNTLKLTLCLGLMSHAGTVKWAFLNKCVQSRLKAACTIVVKAWEVLCLICRVLQLWKRDARNLKDYHTQQSSDMNLFGVQRTSETTKPLQFLVLMTVMTVVKTQGSDQQV